MTLTDSLSFLERFRHWYEYEKDCNRKTLEMLQSVPPAGRSSLSFTRAVGKLAHLVAARHMWLYRLGVVEDRPESSFPPTSLEQLPSAIDRVERLWTEYLKRLTEADLELEFTYAARDGKRYRWRLLDLLTQVFGHAWYHRGQIAMLVKDLGGTSVDTTTSSGIVPSPFRTKSWTTEMGESLTRPSCRVGRSGPVQARERRSVAQRHRRHRM